MTTSLLLDDPRVICACQRRPHVATPTLSRLAARANGALPLALSLCLALSSLGFTKWTPVNNKDVATAATAGTSANDGAIAGPPAELKAIDYTVTPEELDSARRAYFQRHVPYGALIYREAVRNGLEPELVAAIVRAESNFRAVAVSEKNATGLMQLIPSTAQELGVEDLTDPRSNVAAGTKYLRRLHRQYAGNLSLTLAAYNAGEGAVRKYEGVPPYRETQHYVRRVASYRRAFRQAVAYQAVHGVAPERHPAQR
ncbi:MAG: lytic transglycosylase domain-containing protein [Thermoanaerobaculia bacterium]